MSYLDKVKEKRQADATNGQVLREQAKTRHASKETTENLIAELKEIQLAALLGNKQKPQILLTDSTDLGEHIAELGDKIIAVMEAVREDKTTTDQVERLAAMVHDFRQTVEAIQAAGEAQADRIVKAMDGMKKAITAQKPIVVSPPQVSLTEKDIDFSPIMAKLDELKPVADVDLGRFRAQDIDNTGSAQYIGLTDMGDAWQIMYNDSEKNTIRYAFGRGSYDEAWDQRYGHEYLTLQEAVRAIRA